MPIEITDADRQAWRDDGVICLKGLLQHETLRAAGDAFAWSFAHKGPNHIHREMEDGGIYFQDRANPGAIAVYQPLIRRPEFRQILASLWQSHEVWFIFEQIFSRAGGAHAPTPWHQDTLYMPTRGSQLATVWFSLEAVPRATALEFAAGSHKGPLFSGRKAQQDEAPDVLYAGQPMPPMPDIEAERDRWNLVRWDTEPGDAIIFHPSVLHGGGGTAAGSARRTVTLRFFGDDVTVADLGDGGVYRGSTDPNDELYHPLIAMYRQPPGIPFRHPDFPTL